MHAARIILSAVPHTISRAAHHALPPAQRLARVRMMSSGYNSLDRPRPPPLPREQQQEFEELVRRAQAPLQRASAEGAEADLALHPDARRPVPAAFEGEVNPATGEEGGPKTEPVGQWAEDGGDWSFKGRVSDF